MASISNVTSICGTPRGAGGIPSRTNLPSDLLSTAMGRSPCSTWISTWVWLSLAVEKTGLRRVGMVVLRSIWVVATPPRVSMESDRGVTSSRRISFTSPPSTPAWIAAPIATTSSGLTPLCGSLPKKARTRSCTAGMRVIPPTMTTSLISPAVRPASESACLSGAMVRSTRSAVSCSSLARVRVMTRCLGPLASAVRYGRLISVCIVVESSILAFSEASLSRWSDWRSLCRSMPLSFLNCSIR